MVKKYTNMLNFFCIFLGSFMYLKVKFAYICTKKDHLLPYLKAENGLFYRTLKRNYRTLKRDYRTLKRDYRTLKRNQKSVLSI